MATVDAEMLVKRQDVTVKIDSEVKRKADAVASLRSISLAEYLTEILRPTVERDLAVEMRRAVGEAEGTAPDIPSASPPRPKKGGKT